MDNTAGGTQSGRHHRHETALDTSPGEPQGLGTKARTAVVLLVVLPIVLTMTYFYSLWDPTPSLGNIPLAVVNEDEGVVMNGESKNFGKQTVGGLLKADYLDFEEVSAEEAEAGLRDTHYMVTVRIPADFSRKTASVISPNPQHPTIEINKNDLNGTYGAFVTASLVPKLTTAVNKTIATTYAKEVLSGLNRLGGGLNEAANGATRLNEGTGQLRSGSFQLADGSAQLVNGMDQLKDGSGRLRAGTGQLAAGSGQLVNGMDQLAAGGTQLAAGTDQLAAGMARIDGGVNKLTGLMLPIVTNLQELSPTLKGTAQVLRSVQRDEDAAKLEQLAASLDKDNSANLATQLNQLRDGTGQVLYNLQDPNSPYRGGLNKLNAGLQQARNGSVQLNEGVLKVQDGSAQLDDGISRARDGAVRLNDGILKVKDGAIKLDDGSLLLSDGLSAGAEKAPTITQVDASADQIGSPINFVTQNIHPVTEHVDEADPTKVVPSSGITAVVMIMFGFAIMAVLSLLTPDLHRGFHWRKALHSGGVLALIGAVVYASLWGINRAIDWAPVATGSMIAAAALMVLSNTAILVALRSFFSRVTTFLIAMGLFVVGIFSFGGAYPLPVAPRIFRFLHPMHWLSYQREAYVAATEGIAGGKWFLGAAGMIVVIVICLAAIAIRGIRARRAEEEAREAEVLEEYEPGPGDATERLPVVS